LERVRLDIDKLPPGRDMDARIARALGLLGLVKLKASTLWGTIGFVEPLNGDEWFWERPASKGRELGGLWPIPPYSTQDAAALELLPILAKLQGGTVDVRLSLTPQAKWEVGNNLDGLFVVKRGHSLYWEVSPATAPTLALATCRALLKAIDAERGKV